MRHIFEADSIQLEFGKKRILSGIYFKCETGSITGMLGRNGQGKTCLMNIVYGNLTPSNKSVRFDNVTISEAYKRPDLLTYLPQNNFIPGFLSLKRIFLDFNLSFKDFECYFPEFKEKENTLIRKLSGGQRRLIEVYVIIKSKSQFSMLDEPFSHLMPLQIEKINEILTNEKTNKGFLITDHMYRHILDICSDIYVLTDGSIKLTKSLEEIENLGYLKN